MFRYFKLSSLFLVSWFFIHLLIISIYGIIDSNDNADVAVILGNTVNADSTLSPRLTSRLSKGLQLYENGQVNKIIVSGGTGKEGVNEATEMRLFFIKHHVPASSIFTDTLGKSTLLTAKHTSQICEKHKLKTVIIVSQFYHLSRCTLLFKKQKINVLGTTSPSYYEWRDSYSLFREFFGYYYYLFS
jgi:vancomycin permeability regulator SanA